MNCKIKHSNGKKEYPLLPKLDFAQLERLISAENQMSVRAWIDLGRMLNEKLHEARGFREPSKRRGLATS
jgi:hypothetical protein